MTHKLSGFLQFAANSISKDEMQSVGSHPKNPRIVDTSLKPTSLPLLIDLRPPRCRGEGYFRLKLRPPLKGLRIVAASKSPPHLSFDSDQKPETPDDETSGELQEQPQGPDLGWLPAFPHVLTASMANFLFGYHIGVMNGPIEAIAHELGFDGNSFLEGLVVSIFIAGAFIGSLSVSSFVDKFGSRRTFQLDTVPLILGALLSAQAHNLDEMLWGRFLVGLGIGANTVLVPLYISEVSPTKFRGSLGSLCQIGTCLGIIASLALGIPSESNPHWWRTMLFIACTPAFILLFGMQFSVESPRWLYKVGRVDETKKVIETIWGKSEVVKSIEEIRNVIKDDANNQKTSWLELFAEPHNKVAFIGGSLFILQQFAGINGVLYFSSLTFQGVGITNGALASLFVGLTNFAGALFALTLMDNQGRRRLLIGSYLGMAVSMFLIVYAIVAPMDEGSSHMFSVLGTLIFATSWWDYIS